MWNVIHHCNRRRLIIDKNASTQQQASNNQLAPGMTGVEGLDRDATAEEVAEGNMTRVTKLEYDEYDNSEA